MEQKKTLWIVAASGVFLLVVIGAALLLNSPSTSVPATASITTIDRTPVQAKVEEPVISPVTTASSEAALDSNTLAFEKLEGTSEPLPVASAESAESVPAEVAAAKEVPSTQIQLKTESPKSTSLTATSRAGKEALENNSAKTSSTIYTGNPGASKTVASAPKKASPAKPAPKAPAVSSKYWVQAASFTNKKSADNARSALDDNKIPAEVFTYKDNKDTMFYRVRVGPYTTKSEAEYWKTRICKIDMFKGTQSYVTEIKTSL